MRTIKNYTLLFVLMMSISLTACFEEKDDDFTVLGPVATIPTFTISKNNPVAGESISVSIRYYSENIKVKEIRLTETIGTGAATVVTTKTISDFDINNSYVDAFNYVVPAVAAGTVIRLTVEIQTENDLVNSRFGNVTVN
jgi:hypothetical protein